jgi:PurA-like ssDNA and RNA-binding protein
MDRKVYVSAKDTLISTSHLQIERKQFTFDLKENPQGTFLRITEEVGGRRNSIIIPTAGLEQFRDSINETIKFSQTRVGSGVVLPLGQRKSDTPSLGGLADVTMGR